MVKKAVLQAHGDVDYTNSFRDGKDKYADRCYDSKRKPLDDVKMGDAKTRFLAAP